MEFFFNYSTALSFVYIYIYISFQLKNRINLDTYIFFFTFIRGLEKRAFRRGNEVNFTSFIIEKTR